MTAVETKDLSTLLAEKAALEKQIADTKAAEKADAIAQIKSVMNDYDITVEDLTKEPKKRGRKAGADGAERKPVAPKYQLDDKTWTGRGKQPLWVAEALAQGMTLEDLLIEKPAVAAE